MEPVGGMRREIYENFIEYAPDQRKFTTPSNFKVKIRKYCEWKGYLFNPHKYDVKTGLCMFFDADGRPDDSDKTNGVEYFMIGDADKWRDKQDDNENNEKEKENLPFTPNNKKEF